jgi:aconitate hydratase
MVTALETSGVTPVAVLSGNRNFPGRVHPRIDSSFLASPPLVVAYALAGDVTRNMLEDPIGMASDGHQVYLRDLWPTSADIARATAAAHDPADIANAYERAEANEIWQQLDAPATPLFPWDDASTYIRPPPFASASEPRIGAYLAHPLLVLGDDITTDHISPAGQIATDSDAGHHLVSRGEDARDLNVFASRRGNWEVMLRGLFTNKSVRNLLETSLAPGTTIHAPSGDVLPLWQAAERYRADGASVVVVAGDRYGTGSSRDWAAKGLWLLGVRAVLALGFERIHRSNLIGMGILPLLLPENLPPSELALHAGDTLAIDARAENLAPGAALEISVQRPNAADFRFTARAAIETAFEVELLKAGGILPHILRGVTDADASTSAA